MAAPANQLKNAEVKLKQYEEEYNKLQHNNDIDDIKQFKQKIFDAWKNKKYHHMGSNIYIPMNKSGFKQKIFDAWKIKDHIMHIPMIKPTFKQYHYYDLIHYILLHIVLILLQRF